MAFGSEIEALDYNEIRGRIIEVLGTGSATFGYGQPIQSSPVFANDLITKDQWDTLRNDILNARLHQTGASSTVVQISENQVINDTANDPVVNFNAQVTLARENRFDIAPGRSIISAIGIGNDPVSPVPGEYVYKSSWSNSLSLEFTCTFSTADEARYFFNSGGAITIISSISNFSSTAQNQSWNSLLDSIGSVSFGAASETDVTYYALTDTYQTFYSQFSSANYISNLVRLEAKVDVADNVNGTAKILTIKITLVDDYTDPGPPAPGDEVDGDILITLSELKATGTLQPSGVFTIASPVYSVGSFSAS